TTRAETFQGLAGLGTEVGHSRVRRGSSSAATRFAGLPGDSSGQAPLLVEFVAEFVDYEQVGAVAAFPVGGAADEVGDHRGGEQGEQAHEYQHPDVRVVVDPQAGSGEYQVE